MKVTKTTKWMNAVVLIGLLAVTCVSRAAELKNKNTETPAILASLEATSVSVLDDQSAAEVRGEAKYVMTKLPGINLFDVFVGSGASWHANPLAWRYGNWGGKGYSNGTDGGSAWGKVAPVDTMDGFFRTHDQNYALGQWHYTADQTLLKGLKSLPNFCDSYWGNIYSSSPGNAPSAVSVYMGSTIMNQGKVYLGWKNMKFSEYARRQAITAFTVKTPFAIIGY